MKKLLISALLMMFFVVSVPTDARSSNVVTTTISSPKNGKSSGLKASQKLQKKYSYRPYHKRGLFGFLKKN